MCKNNTSRILPWPFTACLRVLDQKGKLGANSFLQVRSGTSLSPRSYPEFPMGWMGVCKRIASGEPAEGYVLVVKEAARAQAIGTVPGVA